MGLACKIGGHKWNKLPDGNDGCTCTRCGERRNEGHDFHLVEGACRETCAICHTTRSIPHEWAGCTCARCGETRDRDHSWGKPEPSDPYFRGDERKTHHTVKCIKCGKHDFLPHTFVQKGNCRHYCPECGYEEVHHEFVEGSCRDCGIDESDYYADLIASGEVGYYDNESRRGQRFVKYGDHVTTVLALTRLFIALANNDGADNYEPKSIVRKLKDIATEDPSRAGDVDAALAQFACDERVHIYWRGWVADKIEDPGVAKGARESVEHWRDAHPRSQADIDYENAMIASDSGLYTTG